MDTYMWVLVGVVVVAAVVFFVMKKKKGGSSETPQSPMPPSAE
jgi:uncharacterized membrane protein